MRHPVVVFDLDGTLADPLDGFARSINHALRLHGLPQREPAALARYIGPPLIDSMQALAGGGTPELHAQLIAAYRQRYGERGFAENTLYAGIPEALDALQAAGCTLGVCTSKRADFAERILAHHGLRERFAFVSGGDIGVHKHQQLQALLATGAIGTHAVMVGDRAVDVTSAHRNGLQACGVRWGFADPGELQAAAPRYLAAAPDALVALLLDA